MLRVLLIALVLWNAKLWAASQFYPQTLHVADGVCPAYYAISTTSQLSKKSCADQIWQVLGQFPGGTLQIEGEVLYALNYQNAISTDGGITWQNTSEPNEFVLTKQIANLTDGKRLRVVSNGLQQQLNGNWQTVHEAMQSKQFLLAKNGTWYLLSEQLLWYSTDQGKNWQHFSRETFSMAYNLHSLQEGANDQLYLNTENGLFRFSPESSHWQLLRNGLPNPEPETTYHLSVPHLAVNGLNILIVIADTQRQVYQIVRSDNGGDSWTELHQGLSNWHIANTSKVYLLQNGTMLLHTSGRGSWQYLQGQWQLITEGSPALSEILPLPNKGVITMCGDRGWAPSQNSCGIHKSLDYGKSWSSPEQGIDDHYKALKTMAAGPDKTIYVSTYGSSVYRLLPGSNSWQSIPTGKSWTAQSLYVEPDGTLFAGSYFGGVQKSEDKGLTWTDVNQGLPDSLQDEAAGISELKGNGNHLLAYVADQVQKHGLYRSSATTIQWQKVSSFPDVSVTTLAVLANHHFIVASGNDLYRSTNLGQTWHIWQKFSGRIIQLIPSGSSGVLVSTAAGLYRNDQNSWLQLKLLPDTSAMVLTALETPEGLWVASASGVYFYKLPDWQRTIQENFTLQADLTIDGSMILAGGELNLNGFKLTIKGNLLHTAGTLLLNGGQLEVLGNYSLDIDRRPGVSTSSFSMGVIIMQQPQDWITVHGDFLTDSNNHDTVMTAGTLEVKGNFSQKCSFSLKPDLPPNAYSPCVANFSSTGQHRILFSGNTTQTVSFSAPGLLASSFNQIIYANQPENVQLPQGLSIYQTALYEISIHKAAGVKSVFQADGGMHCGSNCRIWLPIGTEITVRLTLDNKEKLLSWGNQCSTSVDSCVLIASTPLLLKPTFVAPPKPKGRKLWRLLIMAQS
jgi:hypothetical protein